MRYFVNRRVRILPTASSEEGLMHTGDYGKIVHQTGSIEEGIQPYLILLENMHQIELRPDEVEILD
jgi:hypothetical protein